MAQLPTYAKSPLTIDQQIDLLIERGLKIEDREFAAHALGNVSYYRLSAYSYPFRSRQTPGRFVDGASFETVWQYYRFDRRLKSSEWKSRFLALLEEFPGIHRTSMALPINFENSPLWV